MSLVGRFAPAPRRVATGIAVTLAGVVLTTAVLVPFRSHISADTAALLLVIPVVIGVAIGGFLAAPLGVVAGFLAYDFFFIPPFHTFRVAKPENLVGLLVYGVVGLVVGGVVAQALRAQEESKRRQAETEVLYRLSSSLAAESDLQGALVSVVRLARGVFGFATAAILLEDADRQMRVAAAEGEELPEPLLRWLASRGGGEEPTPLPEGSGLAIPLPSQTARDGLLVVAGGGVSTDARRTLSAFATQTGLAVERARLEEEATRTKMLEDVDRLRSALMGAVSHDLRTPLASIKASISDLANPAVRLRDEDRTLLLHTIEEETDRLTRFVSNLLDMSRIEAGALRVRPMATPLGELVDDVVTHAAPLIEAHPLDLSLPDDLPLVDVDYVLIEQVFRNLLENVGRHTPSGTPVTVSATPVRGRWVEVRVADRGPGVSQPEWDRLFQVFHRPLEARHQVRGTGMGLAICKGIVEAHGGDIWVEQTPAGGATFVFRLPTVEPLGEDELEMAES